MNKSRTLNNGLQMPMVGLGTFLSGRGRETRQAVGWALESGYRLIDTSLAYWNEPDVGWAIHESPVSREEVFITTKLENNDQGYESTLLACEQSLHHLGTDYIDLYLIHWPVPGLRDDTWLAMERLLDQGKCRAIGVSNYTVGHLDQLLAWSATIPAVNQVEFHPFLYQADLLDDCDRRSIVLEAYSPLVKATRMDHPVLVEMGRQYGKTPAQVLIRWHIEHGVPAIPKSVQKDHIDENIDVWDFSLQPDDMKALDGLNENRHVDWDPTGVP